MNTVEKHSSGDKIHDFPIVGIGASAGGLAAFEAFFANMPAGADSGIAFVLVQHLAPDHKSILSELVKRYTDMPVLEVEDGMVVEPNRAYIIPPNKDMAFFNGKLHLLEPTSPRGIRLPIDYFFRSLAQDQHERAICVVLSGAGSDGTAGLRAIKGEGGMAMAQDPGTTQYDAMPRNAIATGLVDYVLPPAKMPAQLIDYVTRIFGKKPLQTAAPDGKGSDTMQKIFVLLRDRTGYDFSQYKLSTMLRRVERRMAVNQLEEMESYYRYFQQSHSEAEALFRDLLIGVTSFFRDQEAFGVLEKVAIPRLLSGKNPATPARIWVPACSTGEEAYSIAMLIHERMEELKQNQAVQLFATDIDRKAIETARAGVYPANIAADVSPERLSRFFTLWPDGGSYRIHKTIRDMVVFSEQSVIKDPPFSRLDMISCRNMLIYMSRKLQKSVIPLFHYSLMPGGLLFLGNAESVGDYENLFSPLDRKCKLYQKRDVPTGMSRMGAGMFIPPLIRGSSPRWEYGKGPGNGSAQLRELMERTLLQRYAPASAIVNEAGDILYIHGRTGKYLEPAEGESGLNIMHMAREGLRRELTTAIRKMAMGKEPVVCQGLRIKTNGDFITINLTVQSVADILGPTAPPGMLLVSFEEAEQKDATESGKAPAGAATDEAQIRIADLEGELKAKEEYLQTAFEEMETSNEELKSTNEEMQSVNEELQSTNEELETSKEELQSVNEELATVNTELQNKVSDLTSVNNDMNNLLAGTGIGTVFVDLQLRIRRFTPTATLAINLIQGDIGRPVSHISTNLDGYDKLTEDAKSVLDTLIPREIEVRTKKGLWYMMRVAPYRTLDNVIEGVVIIFVDVTRRKLLENMLSQSEKRMRIALKDTGITISHQDPEFRYIWIFNPWPGFAEERIISKTDEELWTPEDAAVLSALKKEAMERGQGTRREIQLTIQGVKTPVMAQVTPRRGPGGEITGITCSMSITPSRW